ALEAFNVRRASDFGSGVCENCIDLYYECGPNSCKYGQTCLVKQNTCKACGGIYCLSDEKI
ncbi:12689_t:CDS:2, partial [Ambispora gerdemannii]